MGLPQSWTRRPTGFLPPSVMNARKPVRTHERVRISRRPEPGKSRWTCRSSARYRSRRRSSILAAESSVEEALVEIYLAGGRFFVIATRRGSADSMAQSSGQPAPRVPRAHRHCLDGPARGRAREAMSRSDFTCKQVSLYAFVPIGRLGRQQFDLAGVNALLWK